MCLDCLCITKFLAVVAALIIIDISAQSLWLKEYLNYISDCLCNFKFPALVWGMGVYHVDYMGIKIHDVLIVCVLELQRLWQYNHIDHADLCNGCGSIDFLGLNCLCVFEFLVVVKAQSYWLQGYLNDFEFLIVWGLKIYKCCGSLFTLITRVL